jgi:hypothetical protein
VFPYYCIYDTSNDIIKNNTILFTLLVGLLGIDIYPFHFLFTFFTLHPEIFLTTSEQQDFNGLGQEGGIFSGLGSFIDRRFAFGNH